MTHKLVLVFGGDSISGGVGSWAFQSIGVTSVGDDGQPAVQAASGYQKADASILMLNMAIGGAQLANLSSIGPTYIDPVVVHKADTPAGLIPRKYLFVNAMGSNDSAIDGFATVADYAAANAAAAVARKTAGFDICAMTTLLPRNDGPLTESHRNEYNALITNSSWRATNGIDYAVDLASEATMGNPATCANTTYYIDGIHPTSTGQALLAPIAASVWAAVLGTF
jgi:lysophospholipase L1-like esterase